MKNFLVALLVGACVSVVSCKKDPPKSGIEVALVSSSAIPESDKEGAVGKFKFVIRVTSYDKDCYITSHVMAGQRNVDAGYALSLFAQNSAGIFQAGGSFFGTVLTAVNAEEFAIPDDYDGGSMWLINKAESEDFIVTAHYLPSEADIIQIILSQLQLYESLSYNKPIIINLDEKKFSSEFVFIPK